MVRRIASQVHKQASRLLRANFIKEQPAWYQAVLEHPPIPLPPRRPPPRSTYDLPPPKQSSHSATPRHTPFKHFRTPKRKQLPVLYLEDQVRRQFFRDHPFEAFRATSLVERAGIEDEHPIRDEHWTRLRQRGHNPSPEDAVRFAVSLHLHHSMPLALAYSNAIAQFRSLRSEHHIASSFAAVEAEAYGDVFGPRESDIEFAKEEKALDTWEHRQELDEGAIAARKRWKAIVNKEKGQWSRGEEYVRLWKEGVRPTYAPALTEPMEPSDEELRLQVAENPDFMRIGTGLDGRTTGSNTNMSSGSS